MKNTSKKIVPNIAPNKITLKFTAENVYKELKKKAKSDKVAVYARFFKTGKGQYGEGDVFMGITVPEQRAVVESFLAGLKVSGNTQALAENQVKNLSTFFKENKSEIEKLLKRKEHECRLTALLILVGILRLSDGLSKKLAGDIFNFYIKNIKHINNWDLVDCSTPDVVGVYLFDFERSKMMPFLRKFVVAKNMWERRVAVLACFYAIKRGSFAEIKFVTRALLSDTHDLIHKALGWMLREMGKKDKPALMDFLNELFLGTNVGTNKIPRTTLRYAIERFTPEERRLFMLK